MVLVLKGNIGGGQLKYETNILECLFSMSPFRPRTIGDVWSNWDF